MTRKILRTALAGLASLIAAIMTLLVAISGAVVAAPL
jgi:hypothetical protein